MRSAYSPMATSRSTPSRAANRPIACVLLSGGIAELEHVAEHRPGVPTPVDRAQQGVDSAARIDSGLAL